MGSRKKSRRRPKGKDRPNIRDVQEVDLRDMARLLILYRQAIDLGLARDGEAGRLDFVALAERARSRGRRAGALFYWLLRERKTVFITHADEEEATRRIKSHLYGQDRRRERWGAEDALPRQPKPLELTDDELFVQACLQVAKQRRIAVPFVIARAQGWDRDRWDAALASYEQKEVERWR